MQQTKTQTTTTRNTVNISVRLGGLKQHARTVARADHGGSLSAYIVDLIRRDLQQRKA
jgi:hypothetical protein